MLCIKWCAVALAMAGVAAHAQESQDLRQLQRRLDKLEAQAQPRRQSAFNPEISLILPPTV